MGSESAWNLARVVVAAVVVVVVVVAVILVVLGVQVVVVVVVVVVIVVVAQKFQNTDLGWFGNDFGTVWGRFRTNVGPILKTRKFDS